MNLYDKLNNEVNEYLEELGYPPVRAIMHPLDVYILLQDMVETTSLEMADKTRLFSHLDEMLTQHTKRQAIHVTTTIGEVRIFRSYDIKEGEISLI